MDLIVTVSVLLAFVCLMGMGYCAGREKEKRDVLLALRQQIERYPEQEVRTTYPGAVLWALGEQINNHHHRKLGRRSHYDERRHANPTAS